MSPSLQLIAHYLILHQMLLTPLRHLLSKRVRETKAAASCPDTRVNIKRYTFKFTKLIYVNLQNLCTRTRVGVVPSFPSSLRQRLLRATAQGGCPQIIYFLYLCLLCHSGGHYTTDCVGDTCCPARYSAVL